MTTAPDLVSRLRHSSLSFSHNTAARLISFLIMSDHVSLCPELFSGSSSSKAQVLQGLTRSPCCYPTSSHSALHPPLQPHWHPRCSWTLSSTHQSRSICCPLCLTLSFTWYLLDLLSSILHGSTKIPYLLDPHPTLPITLTLLILSHSTCLILAYNILTCFLSVPLAPTLCVSPKTPSSLFWSLLYTQNWKRTWHLLFSFINTCWRNMKMLWKLWRVKYTRCGIIIIYMGKSKRALKTKSAVHYSPQWILFAVW